MQGSHGRTPARIRAIGVGRAGGSALNRMIAAGVRGVEFVAVHTDIQALARCNAAVKVKIGLKITRGLGSGGDWTKGRSAATGDVVDLLPIVSGADLLFVAAGAGGGTGSGAAPVIAEFAQAAGALTVGLVTRPFRWEGRARNRTAAAAIEALGEHVDALVVVPNDLLVQVVDRKTTLDEAFRIAADVLRQGVQSIAEPLVDPGAMALELADLRAIMTGAGEWGMGIGYASGDRRTADAARQAVTSPLLGRPIAGARRIVVSVVAGEDLTRRECEAAAEIVQAAAPRADLVCGAVSDPRMVGTARVTVIASGSSPN